MTHKTIVIAIVMRSQLDDLRRKAAPQRVEGGWNAADNQGKKERLMSFTKAVVVGVGAEDGLGAALSRCYAANDHHVLVAGRTLEKVEKVVATIRQNGGTATP